MDSKTLCRELSIDAKTLGAWAGAGMPRVKVGKGKRAKWDYDLAAVREWMRAQTAAKKPDKSTGTASGAADTSQPPLETAPLEIHARTVSECVRTLKTLGLSISPRTLGEWIHQEGFPGTPGRPGRQDADFRCRAILAWAGARNLKGEDDADSPRSRQAKAKAELLELELEEKRGNLVPRGEVRVAMQRLIFLTKSVLAGIPDAVANLVSGKEAIAVRDKAETLIERLQESLADQLEQESSLSSKTPSPHSP